MMQAAVSIAALESIFGKDDLDRQWNADFQSLYEKAVYTPHEIKEATEAKQNLYDDFLRFSKCVAEVLVAQLSEPPASWKIKPLKGAGHAGGEKFRVGNLFCKFARDDKRLYGGNDELAIKMAKNEIRCANAVLRLRINSLHLSLMACYRIDGHAVVVTALLPVSHDTLVYGCDNAAQGFDIRKTSVEMSDLIDRVAAQMGLQSHAVRGHPSELQVSIAVDCEGHASTEDGRF